MTEQVSSDQVAPGALSIVAQPEEALTTDLPRKHALPAGAGPPPKRSKKGKKAKGGTSTLIPELNPSDYVRVVKVTNKEDLLHEGPVLLSKVDKAGQMTLDQDRLSVTSSKGYRMARATHGAFQGTWYFEVTISHLGSTGHARIGWSTKKGDLQAPVGYDQHSFSYRDLEGVKVHRGLREPYGEAYSEGDVIGCFLHMPEGGRPFEKEKSDIVTWKGELYFVDEPAADPAQLNGSFVAFSKNGQAQGIAYRDLNEGTYCPAVSLFSHPDQKEGTTAVCNFGPSFAFPPAEIEGLAASAIAELAVTPSNTKASSEEPDAGNNSTPAALLT